MAIDARVRYTKMVIRDSFIKLLKEKSFEQITLKEVCELAGINRSTFYKYYKDIYDWREQMEAECMAGAQAYIDDIDTTDIQTILTRMLESIKENIDLFNALFSVHGGSHILEQTFSICMEKAETKFKKELLSAPQGQKKWECHFLAYGCIGVIQCWIKDGLVQPPKEVAAYIADVLEKSA